MVVSVEYFTTCTKLLILLLLDNPTRTLFFCSSTLHLKLTSMFQPAKEKGRCGGEEEGGSSGGGEGARAGRW